MSEFRAAALSLAGEGYRVFPIRPRGKVPLTANGHNDATNDPDQVRAWWDEHPDANVGLVAGDGLAVLDVDGELGMTAIKGLLEAHGPLKTRLARTGSGGLHLYLKDDPDDPLPQSAGRIAPGLDVRAGGKGYVVAPPSVHPNGTPYVWEQGDRDLAPVPDWLRDAAAEAGQRTKEAASGEREIVEGERNQVLASIGGTMRAHGLSEAAIYAGLQAENEERCDPPLPNDEVQKIAASVARYEPNPAQDVVNKPDATDEFEVDEEAEPAPAATTVRVDSSINLTEEWVVEQLLPKLRSKLRYVVSSKVWYVWTGAHWERDELLRHERIIRRHLTRLCVALRDRADSMSGNDGKPLYAAARRFQNAAGIRNVVALARTYLPVRERDFDADPMLLNTPDGVVDLTTGEVRKADPEGMHSRTTGVAPKSGRPKLWLDFLGYLTEDDEDTQRYLQKVMGYGLTGDVAEKLIWFAHGANSDTGKSTFVHVAQKVMGTYAESIDASAFISTNDGRVPDDIAQLPGARLVTATEPSAGQAWSEKAIKSITGGDEISARRLYGSWFQYQPQFKILVVGNHQPEVRAMDDAMLRRIHIIPMNRKVPRDQQVPHLDEIMFKREGPQILSWLLEGVRLWREEGIGAPPEAVAKTTNEYLDEETPLLTWIQEECELDPDHTATRRELFRGWSQWCRARNEKPGGFKSFKRKLDPHTAALELTNQQVGDRRLAGYRGIRPRTEFDTEEL